MDALLRVYILERLAAVDEPSTPAPAMLAALRELDALSKDPASALPGDLHHYLSRRSYAKARMFLENLGPIPSGDCGRGSGR